MLNLSLSLVTGNLWWFLACREVTAISASVWIPHQLWETIDGFLSRSLSWSHVLKRFLQMLKKIRQIAIVIVWAKISGNLRSRKMSKKINRSEYWGRFHLWECESLLRTWTWIKIYMDEMMIVSFVIVTWIYYCCLLNWIIIKVGET